MGRGRLTPDTLGVLLLLCVASLPLTPAVAQSSGRIQVVSGVTDSGTATPLWQAMLRHRLSASAYDTIAGLHHALTPEERAWAELIRTHAGQWLSEAPQVTELFTPAGPPESVTVVLGNRGGGDVFTHDPTTIGFDLSELHRVYGAAERPDAGAMVDRFFRHEFAHLLQKRWLPQHPWPVHSPLQSALLDIWLEGLGNFYSLSPRWVGDSAHPSAEATAALAELEPRFVARMAGLACADSAAAAPLLKDLSSGPFTQKWGAVSAALWLAAEPGPASDALRRFIVGGPGAVWDLAARHLPPDLAARLVEVRHSAEHCPG